MQNPVFENTVFYCQPVRGPTMKIIDWALTSPSICLQIVLSLKIFNLQYLTYYCTNFDQTKTRKSSLKISFQRYKYILVG